MRWNAADEIDTESMEWQGLGGLCNLSKHSIYNSATQSLCVSWIQSTNTAITCALLQMLFIKPLLAIPTLALSMSSLGLSPS